MTEDELRDRFRKMTEGKFGLFGERFWSGVFASAGYRYIPLCKIAGIGAPMTQGDGKIVLPDFEVSGGQVRLYVDSKAKRGPVIYRVAGNEPRHGIDKRNWLHYADISMIHRQHCGLAIFEAFTDEKTKGPWSGALLLQTLFKLGEPFRQHGNKGTHMVYWPRAKFQELGKVDALEAIDICNRPCTASRFKAAITLLFRNSTEHPPAGSLFS